MTKAYLQSMQLAYSSLTKHDDNFDTTGQFEIFDHHILY